MKHCTSWLDVIKDYVIFQKLHSRSGFSLKKWRTGALETRGLGGVMSLLPPCASGDVTGNNVNRWFLNWGTRRNREIISMWAAPPQWVVIHTKLKICSGVYMMSSWLALSFRGHGSWEATGACLLSAETVNRDGSQTGTGVWHPLPSIILEWERHRHIHEIAHGFGSIILHICKVNTRPLGNCIFWCLLRRWHILDEEVSTHSHVPSKPFHSDMFLDLGRTFGLVW